MKQLLFVYNCLIILYFQDYNSSLCSLLYNLIKLFLIDQSHSSQIAPKVLVETKVTCIFVYHLFKDYKRNDQPGHQIGTVYYYKYALPHQLSLSQCGHCSAATNITGSTNVSVTIRHSLYCHCITGVIEHSIMTITILEATLFQSITIMCQGFIGVVGC